MDVSFFKTLPPRQDVSDDKTRAFLNYIVFLEDNAKSKKELNPFEDDAPEVDIRFVPMSAGAS